MKRKHVVAVAVVGSTVVLGAAIGSIAGVVLSSAPQHADAATSTSSAQEAAGDSSQVVEKYETNQSGQTYGEYAVGLISDPGAHPDLILVVATNGLEGYSYYDEVFGRQPSSLEEAVALSRKELTKTIVPVYLEDGKTQIGEYVANS